MDRVVTAGAIAAAIADRFPLERAEGWDRCGLLAGDASAPVTGVALALDPTLRTIDAAHAAGANVLVTHHPAFLEPPRSIVAGGGPGGVIFAALSHGIALLNAHTNLDRDAGAQALMPQRLGMTPERPLETGVQPMSMVATYVPAESAEAVRAAMARVGAGRIGDYTGCSFSSDGTGRFRVPEGASPAIGNPGESATAEEERIEMVCPAANAVRVAVAAAAASPYEEPMVTVTDVGVARNAAALGMLSSIAPLSLGELAELSSAAYGCTPRVWGDSNSTVTLVATGTGSAGSLISAALGAGAQVLVAGEVRYHDALSAMDAGLSVIELGHDVTEWPLVGLLESVVRAIDGLSPDQIHVFEPRRGWWTPQDQER